MLVSVIGATGRQGLAQVRQLLAAGHQVRAISRRSDAFGHDRQPAVEVRVADLTRPEGLPPALDGSDAVFFTHPLSARADRVAFVTAVGQAAHRVGVKRVVWNTSSWIPDRAGEPFTYAMNTAGVNALFRTGVPATVFGAVLFMDNLLTHWARPFIVDESRFVYPHRPDLEANWISLDDVAKFMIASLDRPDFEGSWMNIGGPERLRPGDVAASLSAAFGREIRFDPCTPAEFGALLVKAMGEAIPAEHRTAFAGEIAAFYEHNNRSPTRPFEVNMDYVLDRLPIELETLTEWAKRQDWSGEGERPSAG